MTASGKSQPDDFGPELDPHELRRMLGDWRTGGGPLYRQLADAVDHLIISGHLEPETTLPPERRLADVLGVSRNSVVAAYGLLRDRDVVRTRRGSGTTVAGRDTLSPRAARIAGSLTPNGVFDGFLSPQPDAIDLRAGYWIGTDELPPRAFDIASDPEHHCLLHGSGYHPWGIPELRGAIAARLSAQGLPTTPDELIVTTGAQQAIALLVSMLVDPRDPVLVEDPTYPGAIDLLRAYGATVHPVARDDHGPDLMHLRRAARQVSPRLFYVVLSGHNPTGSVAPEPVRVALARLVDEGLTVIDDLSLADTGQDDPPPPLAAYVSADARGRVITVGSLSKTMWGGLRVGWLRAPRPLLRRLVQLKTIHDVGTPASIQLTAVRLLEELPTILDRRRRAIRHRRTHLETSLSTRLPDWRWRTPDAGLCLWVDVGTNSVDFAAHASRFGVELAPGTISSPVGSYADKLRIPFGQPTDVLTLAVDRMATAWADFGDAPRRLTLLV